MFLFLLHGKNAADIMSTAAAEIQISAILKQGKWYVRQ
jgi:hypothetical protein